MNKVLLNKDTWTYNFVYDPNSTQEEKIAFWNELDKQNVLMKFKDQYYYSFRELYKSVFNCEYIDNSHNRYDGMTPEEQAKAIIEDTRQDMIVRHGWDPMTGKVARCGMKNSLYLSDTKK